ncbi:uncharacterized protein PG986_008610 [Apiospora aurea]|uniref:Knr4/Smi1-like domain-containing protein n=1 Tax=Apiospora aurea TaxID=335848 RepID=A0ABR1Q5D4_9PEZI
MASPQHPSLPARPRAAASDEQEAGRPDTKEAYSHDATVAAITSIPCPTHPPGGWEGFDRDNLKTLQENGKYNNGLTDRVLDLMRQIPYFDSVGPELMFMTHPADHREHFCDPKLKPPETDDEKKLAEKYKAVSVETYEDHLPPHLMVLTTGHPWRCYTILIDTELGAVRFWDRYDGQEFPTEVPGDLGYEEDRYDIDQDGPDGWRAAPIYRISTFFDLWRKEFLDWNKELMYRSDEEEEEEEEEEGSENEDKDEQEAQGETFDDDRAKL